MFMENIFARKLCENACTLQGAGFLLKKEFAFPKLRTRNIVFKAFTSSSAMFLRTASNIK